MPSLSRPPRNRHRKLRLEKKLHSALLCHIDVACEPEEKRRPFRKALALRFLYQVLAKMDPKALAAMHEELHQELFSHPWSEVRLAGTLAMMGVPRKVPTIAELGFGAPSWESECQPGS